MAHLYGNRFHKGAKDKSLNARKHAKFESLWDVVLYLSNRRPGSAQSSSGGSGSVDEMEEEVQLSFIAKWKR